MPKPDKGWTVTPSWLGLCLQPASSALFDETWLILSMLLTGTAATAGVLALLLPLAWPFVATVLLPLVVIYGIALWGLSDHPHTHFGPANIITALRAAMVCLTASTFIWFEGLASAPTALWILIGFVLAALSLDGVDGYLARRFRQQSTYGARFDMEVDAFLILVLSAAAVLLGKAGLWVLLIGAMRYGFVVVGWMVPRLTRPLFASTRRKLVCVLQILSLCVLLLPVVTPPVSMVIAATALAALVYSFAVDTLSLLRRP